MKNIVIFIFARGGSKGIPSKNLINFDGVPLIGRAINFAKKLPIDSPVFVSTDDPTIASIAKQFGAVVPFIRPGSLATDQAKELDAWKHAIHFMKEVDGCGPEVLISIPTTTPFRDIDDVTEGLDIFVKRNADMVVGVTRSRRNPFFNMVSMEADGRCSIVGRQWNATVFRRQDAIDTWDLSTAFFIANCEYVLATEHLYDGQVYAHPLPRDRGLDLDDLFDLELAESLALARKGN